MFESSLPRSKQHVHARASRLACLLLLAGLAASPLCYADAAATLPPPPAVASQ